MKTLLEGLAIAYLCWYTIGYARIVWKDGKKLASVFITLLAISLAVIPLWVKLNE